MSYMITAKEAAAELGISIAKCYVIFRELNKELADQGYIVIPGKLPRSFWEKKTFR